MNARLARFFAEEISAWRGQASLARVFWLKGVLTTLVLSVLYATTVAQGQHLAEQLLLIFLAVYTVWILVAIWRCARGDDSFWALMARLLTVAWAGNAALVILFRQLDLLAGSY